MPTLTVIIPTHNSEKFIEKLLQCLDNQTYSDFCILVVDDCSIDNTVLLIKNYPMRKSKISLIELNDNHGVSYCRNIGIKNATTPYLTFIDHDDWIDLNTYENCRIFFSQSADIINYGLSYDYDDFMMTEKKYIYKKSFCLFGDYALKIYGHTIHDEIKITPIVNNKIYRTDFLQKNGIYFNEGIRYQEDDIFTFKTLISAGLVAFTADCYYHYFQNPESALHMVSDTSINHFVLSYSDLQKFLKEHGLFERYKNEFYLKFKSSLLGVIRRTVQFGKDISDSCSLLASLYRQLYENFNIAEFLHYCNIRGI